MTGWAWLAQQQEPVSLTWPAIAGGLAAVTVVIGAVVAAMGWAYRRLRAWVQRTAAAAERTASAVATSNGRSLGALAEHIVGQLGELRAEIDVVAGWAGENRNSALEAHRRLDAHLVAHGKEE